MRRILILGGTGAMGESLVDILNGNKKYDVKVTSREMHDSVNNIVYVKGNARDSEFMKKLLSDKYDIIVDFMNYGYQEFMYCHRKVLASTKHYVFLSSSRVYANSEEPLTENSERLLEVSSDQEFLSTQRYALRKARQ